MEIMPSLQSGWKKLKILEERGNLLNFIAMGSALSLFAYFGSLVALCVFAPELRNQFLALTPFYKALISAPIISLAWLLIPKQTNVDGAREMGTVLCAMTIVC